MASANPWFSKAGPWSKPRVVPLPKVETLSPSSTEDAIVILDDDAIDDTVRQLEHAIVGRMFGRRIPPHVLSGELRRRWGGFGNFRFVTLTSDCFLCIFDNSEACNAILLDGPWVILGQVLGVDRWTPSFSPSSLEGFRTPVWIRMPGLPLYCWSAVNISKIAAHIGEPMWMDSTTAQLEKGLFARACVRLDLSKPLRPGIWVRGRHGKFFQPLEYEGLSVFCCRCAQVGHKTNSCKIAGSNSVASGVCHVNFQAGSNSERCMDLTAGAPPKSIADSIKDVACLNTPCRDDLHDPGPHHEDRGVGPWMLVTHKKKAPKAAPLKNVWKAAHVKPSGPPVDGVGPSRIGSQPMHQEASQVKPSSPPVDGVGPSRLGSQPMHQELPPSIDSYSPSRCVKENQGMEDVRPPVMGNCEPQSAENDQPVSLVFTALSKRDRQLDVPQPPAKLPAKVRSRRDKIRGAKKDKMVCELGPITPGSRKRHKAQSITDGGDGSPFEEP